MTTDNKTTGSETRIVKKRRYWSRTDSPTPWNPWGTAQLLWIGLLFLIGVFLVAPGIEADVRTQVGDRLHAAGIPSATVTANGQAAVVRADANETSEMVVQTIAASTRCRTWAGQLPCPTAIDVKLDATDRVMPQPTSRLHEFTAVGIGNNVTLSGEVPNIVEQDRILGTARQYFDVVTNQMTITNQPATADYTAATNSAIASVGSLQKGQAQWSDGSLSISGSADAAGAATSREHFDSIGGHQVQGTFNVSAADTNNGCKDKFENAFVARAIRFRTNSATIDGSEELLEDLSQIATTCPGQLTVEGHTDNRGSDEMNKALSQARADSVLAALTRRGVDASRLNSIGYGEQHPIADNETAAGRAANRRISISTQLDN